MSGRVLQGKGSLFKVDDEQFVTDVTYRIRQKQPSQYGFEEWEGTLQSSRLDALESLFFAGTHNFTLKTEDGRKGRILIRGLRKGSRPTTRINFTGSGSLE
jgi:hypothetical protein